MDMIKRARLLLSKVLLVVNHKSKYEDILKKNVVATKQDICDRYRCSEKNIVGVFGKYTPFISKCSKDNGRSIIQKTAKAIVKTHKIIVTGERIYHMKGEKINSEIFIIDKLNREIQDSLSKEDKGKMGIIFSKAMGLIPYHAIFLIDEKRSASIHEEGSFFSKNAGSAIGVIISPKSVKTCKHISQITNIEYSYFRCNQDCHENRPKCFAKRLGINMTTTEPFIKHPNNFLIFVEDLRHIGRAVNHIITENQLIFDSA